MRKAIGEAAEDSTRTAAFVFRRTREILAEEDGDGPAALPSESTLYRLFARLEAGRHTTGSARTRRSLGARPDGPFGQVPAAAPGDVMQIDSTPLDVLVRLDNGVTGRVEGFLVVRHVPVGVPQRPLHPPQLQRRNLVARGDLDRIQVFLVGRKVRRALAHTMLFLCA